MMVRIFILKASGKREACGKLCVSVGVPEDYSRREAMRPVVLNRRHWLPSGNRIITEENRIERKGKERKGKGKERK